MKNVKRLFVLVSLVLGLVNTSFASEEYVYTAVCVPKQSEDVARVVKGAIWLALRGDATVASFSVDTKVIKAPSVVRTISQTDLLKDLGFQFNSGDLSISMGNEATGFSCLADAQLRIRVQVKRKDGTVALNEVINPIKVAGTLATKGKIKAAVN